MRIIHSFFRIYKNINVDFIYKLFERKSKLHFNKIEYLKFPYLNQACDFKMPLCSNFHSYKRDMSVTQQYLIEEILI